MERLLKHTPEGNDDLILLPEVISKLDEQIKKLNDSIAAAEFQSIVSTLTFKNQTENNIPYGATQLFYKGNVKCKSHPTQKRDPRNLSVNQESWSRTEQNCSILRPLIGPRSINENLKYDQGQNNSGGPWMPGSNDDV